MATLSSKSKFWNFTKDPESGERELFLEGDIDSGQGWFGTGVSTYDTFKQELYSGRGKLTLWINSFGGDVFTASQIYATILDYPYEVTVKISGIAASAASFIAMAGDKVLMSPTALMIIHSPLCIVMGNAQELRKTAETLDEVQEAIINAYEIKSKLPRAEISKLMDAETMMNANNALEKGFIDGLLTKETGGKPDPKPTEEPPPTEDAVKKMVQNLKVRSAFNKLTKVTIEIEEDDPDNPDEGATKTPEKEEAPDPKKEETPEKGDPETPDPNTPEKEDPENPETPDPDNPEEEEEKKPGNLTTSECYARLNKLEGDYLI